MKKEAVNFENEKVIEEQIVKEVSKKDTIKKNTFASVISPVPLNLRDKPNGKVIKTIEPNETVQVINKKKEWFKIRHRGIEGYCMSEYLKER